MWDYATQKVSTNFREGQFASAVGLSLVDATKREILELYNDDFYKIDPTGKAASLFKAIPAQLYGNAHKYQITPVIGDVDYNRQIFCGGYRATKIVVTYGCDNRQRRLVGSYMAFYLFEFAALIARVIMMARRGTVGENEYGADPVRYIG